MSQARNTILQRLRAEKWSGANPGADENHYTSGPLPALGADLQAHFELKLENNIISFDHVNDDRTIVDSVMGFLQAHSLPLELCLVQHPMLGNLPWPHGVQAEQRTVANSDLNVLTVATAAIAETGSVVMVSSETSPTEANFLPDNFICIVERATLLAHMEDLWSLLRKQSDRTPAVINIISGPSRTADVEQTIQLGAHGPRRMHLLIKE